MHAIRTAVAVCGQLGDSLSPAEVRAHLDTVASGIGGGRQAAHRIVETIQRARDTVTRALEGGQPERLLGMLDEVDAAVASAEQQLVSAEDHVEAQTREATALGTASGAVGSGVPSGDVPHPPAVGTSNYPRGETAPTGIRGGSPTGRATRIGPREDDDVRRSLQRENDAASVLAAQGFQVQQNPSQAEVAESRRHTGDVGRADARPDYLVEGRVFDCYSPRQPRNVRGIWSEVATKVEAEQTQRVVVNLQDWGDNVGALRRQFADWPIEGLKEVKAVTPDRRVVSIWHREEG